MKQSLLFLLFSLFLMSWALAKEPTNLAVVKQDLIRYHDSGEYEKDMNKIENRAMQYLSYRLNRKDSTIEKPAIVLDIDETSLSNYKNMVSLNFGGTLEEIRANEKLGQDDVIKPTLKLYRFAKENHIAIFFISGRLEEERAITENNLRQVGFDKWDGLILRSDIYKKASAAEYKTAMRKNLVAQGYNILLNIGDQQSDLIGQYADKNFKLPNPYYYIP